MSARFINLKILLPFKVFAQEANIEKIVAETSIGSFGILPQRLDCVAALVPGILSYKDESEDDIYIAVDEGILVKTGRDVLISVRNAIRGNNLAQLRKAVDQEFLILNEQAKNARLVIMKMESSFISRLEGFHND